MLFLICTVLIIMLFMVALLNMDLIIILFYQRDDLDDLLHVELVLWKLPPYKIKISTMDLKAKLSGIGIKFKGKTGKSGAVVRRIVTTLLSHPEEQNDMSDAATTLKVPFQWKKMKKKIKRVRELHDHFWPATEFLLSNTRCLHLTWQTGFGTGDAAVTGWSTGIGWTVKTALVRLLYKYLVPPPKPPRLVIKPEFNKKCFHTTLDCAFKVKLYYLARAGIRLLKVRMKKRKYFAKG
ncbi:DUF2953 domain-containing protein [Desulfofalx alkaliphila]|uniref:DUF2953 domain-containing protein n=1 Tax=Desulfofalx alkaliphila TaxID=105483 RepID=UPI0004E142CE|nr:DUF2953 domain-containing protein [Desulfofalx alkaliphila]